MATLSGKDRKLCDALMQMGLLDAQAAEKAASGAKFSGELFSQYLVRSGTLSAADVSRAQAQADGLPWVDLATVEIPVDVGELFPYFTLKDYGCTPFADDGTVLKVAAPGRLPPSAVRDLEIGSKRKVECYVAAEGQVQEALKLLYQGRIPRRFTRYEFQAPVRVQFCSRLGKPIGAEVSALVTLNISQGGLATFGMPSIPDEVARSIPLEAWARVTLDDPDLTVQALCRLCWTRREDDDGGNLKQWILGMEIAEISGPDQERLVKLCAKAAKTTDPA